MPILFTAVKLSLTLFTDHIPLILFFTVINLFVKLNTKRRLKTYIIYNIIITIINRPVVNKCKREENKRKTRQGTKIKLGHTAIICGSQHPMEWTVETIGCRMVGNIRRSFVSGFMKGTLNHGPLAYPGRALRVDTDHFGNLLCTIIYMITGEERVAMSLLYIWCIAS